MLRSHDVYQSVVAAGIVLLFAVPRSAVAGERSTAADPLFYDTWEHFTTGDGLPHDSIRAIHVAQPHVWVGTEGGLARFDGRTWKSWTKKDGLGCSTVMAIDVDPRTDEVWIGTWGGGLVRFSAGRFDRFSQLNSGLAGDLIFDVCIAAGRIWVATSAGLCVYDPVADEWVLHFARRADRPESVITRLCRSGSDLFVAGWNGKVQQYDHLQHAWKPAGEAGHSAPAASGLAVRSRMGMVGFSLAGLSRWLVTQRELYRQHESGRWDALRIDLDSDADNFVRCLAARNETEIWVGTNKGLRCLVDWPNGTWVTYRRCGGGSGLVSLSRGGGEPERHAVASTIPDNRIRCVAFDSDSVWVGTTRGLARGSSKKPLSDSLPASDGARQVCPPLEFATASAAEEGAVHMPEDFPTIGVLAPIVQSVMLPGAEKIGAKESGRADRLAVQLAVVEANAHGGYRGRVPFGLAMGLRGYERYGWGTFEDDFGTLLNRGNALGIVSSVGLGDIIRSAVAFQTEVPVVTTSASASHFHSGVNPWVFRCPGDDPRRDERLIEYIVKHYGHTRLGFVRTPDKSDEARLSRWSSLVRRRFSSSGISIEEVGYGPDSGDPAEALRSLDRAGVEVVMTCCDAALSASILVRMRELGMGQLFVGDERIVCDEFLDLAGVRAAPVLALVGCPYRGRGEKLARFTEKYLAQNTEAQARGAPSPEAYLTFHATSHLLHAVNLAGPDRDAIRAMLVKLRDVWLGVLEDGQWRLFSVPVR